MDLATLAGRVEAAGFGPVRFQRNGTEFKICCPVHEDRTPSCLFKTGVKGDIVGFCFGCRAKGDTLAPALGIDIKEFFAKPLNGNGYNGSNGRSSQGSRLEGPRAQAKQNPPSLRNVKETRYRVRDSQGKLVAVHVRLDGTEEDGKPGKRFWWELPDGARNLGALKTADLPLYRSELLAEQEDAEMPILVEGEKACDALIRFGLPAVGTACGAAATPSDETLKPLIRFASVTLWPDNDGAGQAHMERIHAALKRLGAPDLRWVYRSVETPKGFDAADITEKSKALDFIVSAKEWVPEAGALTSLGQNGDVATIADGLPVPWETRDLAEVANEAYLQRTAVVDKLMYTSSVSMVTGGKHAGKSTLVRWLAICVAKGLPFLGREVTQGPVFYIASEDETMAARQELIRLGWDRNDPLRFLSSSNIVEENDAFLQRLTEEIRREGAMLSILDMLFDFVRIPDEMSYAGTREALGKIQKVATEGGSHIVAVHHAPKNALIGDAAVAALGSQGLAARVSPIILVRRFGPGVHSISSTSVRDPRGEQIVDSRLMKTAGGGVELGGAFKATMLAEVYVPKIQEFLEEEPGSEFTASDLVEQLELTYEVARACLGSMYRSGIAERVGAGKKGKPYRYYIPTKGVKAAPPAAEDLEAPTVDQGRFGYKD